GERGGRALRGAGLRQEGGEAAVQAEGRQVDALLEELPGRGAVGPALVRVRPRHTDRPAVDDGEGAAVDGVAVVEGHQAAGAVAPDPLEDLDRGHGAADGEIAHQQEVAVVVRAGEGAGAVAADVAALADGVDEEPEAGGGVAAVVEAVEAGVEDLV